MTRGTLQKYMNRANVVAASTLGALLFINSSPHLADKFYGRDNGDAEASAAGPIYNADGQKLQICFTDDFKQACADTLEGAEKKFRTNPQPISPTERLFNAAARGANRAGNYIITVGIPDFHTNRYQGVSYKVPNVWKNALASATRNDPITSSVMAKVLGSESGFKNQSSHTGAFSVGQFTLSTFMETAYQHRGKLSAGQKAVIEKNIDQYNVGTKKNPIWRYRIDKGGDVGAVRALANSPNVTAVLVREHMRTATKLGEDMFHNAITSRINFMKSDKYDGPRDENYERRLELLDYNLKRPMTAADVKVFYLCGSRGGSQILFAVADPRTHHMRANDFTTKGVVNSNPDVFFNTDEKPRSVYDFYNYIVHRVGNEALPGNLNRTQMAQKPGRSFDI